MKRRVPQYQNLNLCFHGNQKLKMMLCQVAMETRKQVNSKNQIANLSSYAGKDNDDVMMTSLI